MPAHERTQVRECGTAGQRIRRGKIHVVLAHKRIFAGGFIGRMPAHERTQVRECGTAGQKTLQIFQGQASPPGFGFHKEKNHEFR
ncbi:MAG: hypothetical protein EGQ98_06805 [Clostridium sp.]|nr:hypothetical protein [Clostridium sp.]